MRLLLFLAVLSLSHADKHVNLTWTDCSAAGAKGSIDSVDILPNPPVLGTACTLTGHGTLLDDFSDGQSPIKATFNNLPIPVTPSTISACGTTPVKLPLGLGTVTVKGVDCPAKAGKLDITEVVTIPAIAPAGTYTAELRVVDDVPNEVICVRAVIVVTGS